jgi:hypothetical protein
MDLRKYTKHKRPPTKHPTKKISGKKIVSCNPLAPWFAAGLDLCA